MKGREGGKRSEAETVQETEERQRKDRGTHKATEIEMDGESIERSEEQESSG